jgi:hypothetical protein
MPIEFNAREFAVSDRSAWSTTKSQVFGLLKIKSIETVANALRLGKPPPRHLQERYTEPSRGPGRKAHRTWLMASRVASTTDGWEITVVYFGSERDVPFTELTAGDVLHSEKVLHEEYSTTWRGHVFVVEAVPAIGTPPSPLQNAYDALLHASIEVTRNMIVLLKSLLAIGNFLSMQKSFGARATDNRHSIFHQTPEPFIRRDELRATKRKAIHTIAEIGVLRNREHLKLRSSSVAPNTSDAGARHAASTRLISQPSLDLLSQVCRQTDARLAFAKYSPEAVGVTPKAAFQSAPAVDVSIDSARHDGGSL